MVAAALASVTADDRWEILDDLTFGKPGERTVRLHWLLLDGDWTIKQSEAGLQIRLRTPAGLIRINIAALNISSPGLDVMLIRAGRVVYGRGEPLAYEGWFSPTYGVIEPALSLSLQASSSGSCRFVTDFILHK